MGLLHQEQAAAQGEQKRLCCSEVAQVAAVPPCARKSAVLRSSCSLFSQLPAAPRHCKAHSKLWAREPHICLGHRVNLDNHHTGAYWRRWCGLASWGPSGARKFGQGDNHRTISMREITAF